MISKKSLLKILVLLSLCITVFCCGCFGSDTTGGNSEGNTPGGSTGGDTEEKYTITFVTNGAGEIDPMAQEENTVIIYPSNPVKVGYVFEGWFLDEDLTNENSLVTMPKQNITLYAKWTIGNFTITFETNGGSEIEKITQVYDTEVTAPDNPTKNSCDFGGWFIDEDFTTEYTFSKMPGENITLYAKWIEKTYRIRYEVYDGENNADNPSSFVQADDVITLKEPTKEYNVFMGWFTDEGFTQKITKIDPSVASDVKVYAKWICYLTFKYDSNYDYVVTFNSEARGLVDHVDIPAGHDGNSVDYIGAGGFQNSGIKSITIPDSITTIKNDAFLYCSKLERVNVSSIKEWVGLKFTSKGSNPLYRGANETQRKLYVNDQPVTEIAFTDDIYVIEKYVFYGYDALTKVTFSDSISYADQYAFAKCKNLKTIDSTPECNMSFLAHCFDGCISLTDLTLPNKMEIIGESAFVDCIALAKVVIPDTVVSVWEYAFNSCEKLTDVTFSKNLEYIGRSAFGGCRLKDVVLPSTVKQIESGAFSSNEMTSIVLPAGLESIGNNAFAYNYLKSIVIPKSVTTVGECIFNGNSTTGGEHDNKIQILCETAQYNGGNTPQGWEKRWHAYYDSSKPYDSPYSYYYNITWSYKAQ